MTLKIRKFESNHGPITAVDVNNKFLAYLPNTVVATHLTSPSQISEYDSKFHIDPYSRVWLIEPNPDFISNRENPRTAIVGIGGYDTGTPTWDVRVYDTSDKKKGRWFRLASGDSVDKSASNWSSVAKEVSSYVLADSKTENYRGENMLKTEATRFGAGMAKRTDFSKTRNLGEILEVLNKHRDRLEQATKDINKSEEELAEAIKLLNTFEASADLLRQQSTKGIKKAMALKNSPKVRAASEVESALKNVLSIIMTDYENVDDVKQLMTVIDSRYATRGSKILSTLSDGISNAIEVDYKTLKDSVDKGEIEEDDIMTFVSLTSVSHGVKDKGVATKVQPILERMNAMVDAAGKAEEAVIDPKQFIELRDLVKQLVDESNTPKTTIKTTITTLDADTIASVPTESKVTEGIMDKIKSVVDAITTKIASLWQAFTSLFFSLEDEALESADVFNEIELDLAIVGISVMESYKVTNTLGKQFEVLTKSVLTCCDNLVKDSSLAGEFDDEVIYAEDAVANAVESFQQLGYACENLKRALSSHKNEDNLNVIGILADAITQIVADDEDTSVDKTSNDVEDDSRSVIDDIESEYSPEREEPMEEPSPMGMEEPEEF